MELIVSSGILTLLVLIGAFVDFLRTAWSPYRLAHGDAFWAEPKHGPVAKLLPDLAVDYDRAA